MEKDKCRYAEDKPISCEYCYYWKGKGKGCERKTCYYILPEKAPPTVEELAKYYQRGNCDSCPYGRASPCIGFCIEKILLELKAYHGF